jgi:outer membrane protein
MLKRITTKESDIVNPLMAKVRASIQKSSERIQYVLDGSTLYLLTVQI